MPCVKLFVCCHQPTRVPKHPLLVPIQVGTALADARFPGFLHDDTGDNISAKNLSYCELTAQYWAWKNIESDYYGFFHYRRYLYPEAEATLPYHIEKYPNLSSLDKLGYSGFTQLIQKYNLIVPKSENMYLPVRAHYANALYHHGKDLELVERIVQNRCPAMSEAMSTYLSGTVCYFGNIYIMQREVFHDYCAWLFPILEEFDRCADTSQYSVQEQRVDGYLAERLLGVYVTHWRANHMSVLELPRVHFNFAKGKTDWRTNIIYQILPPGSRRRALAKAGFTTWKRKLKKKT